MKDRGEYDNSVDIWSLGVMTYELLSGLTPFKTAIADWKLLGSKRSLEWSWDIIYPPIITDKPRNFIENILKVSVIERFTILECKNHEFLR